MAKLAIRLITLLLALCLFAPVAHAQSEVEPNDDFETATGPLAAGVTYEGVLPDEDDFDAYFFYVTGESSQVEFTIVDPTVDGGGVYVELDDSEGGVVDSIDVFAEDFDTLAATLDPGKYFLLLTTEESDQFDEAYEIDTAGDAGAFASPAIVQAECRTAAADTSKAQAALDRAKRRLKQALRGGSHGRKARARHAVKIAKAKLRAATALQQVCSISA
jgi:hypothetical protein